VQRVFVTAHDITPYWHMKMQSAFQRHCDSSISKTINFPHEATGRRRAQIFELAIDEDVKGVTVYRDGCREMQPMALSSTSATDRGAGLGSSGRARAGSRRTRAGHCGRAPAARTAQADQAARDHELPAASVR
jgi:hypothetical protein